jgi:predicted exporter
MSFISTEICFIAFLFAPFSILRQFAVFAAAGLLSAYLSALCLYPVFPFPAKRRIALAERLKAGKTGFDSQTPRLRRILTASAITLAAVIILFVSSPKVRIENNLASFYRMEGFLLESEKKAAAVLDYGSAPFYYIVKGSSREDVLQRDETLAGRLETEIKAGKARALTAAALLVPSEKRQREYYDALGALLPLAASQYEALGFPASLADQYRKEYESAKGKYLRPESVPRLLADTVSNLWIGRVDEKDGEGFYSAVMLLRAEDEEVFRSIAGEFDGVFFVNKAKDIGKDLNSLTKIMLALFCAAFVFSCVPVIAVYKLKKAAVICAAPVFTVLCTLAVLALLGIPLGFFSVSALLLSFGLGLDYMFYLADDGKVSGHTVIAVWLSFLTTLLSFGALAFSGFVPVHLFGLTAALGLGFSFLASRLLKS